MKNIAFVFCLHILYANILDAQTAIFHCGSNVVMDSFNYIRPELQKKIEEKIYGHYVEPLVGSRNNVIVTLPIVFHIIHNNGAENVPDNQIITLLANLNNAYANNNSFKNSDGVDTRIQFCLAQRTPDDKKTTGITRDVSTLTKVNLEADDLLLKGINTWNPKDYINVWVVKEISSSSSGGSVLGYAYLASAHGMPMDGIVIEAGTTTSGVKGSAVLIHEMGHYLNLLHTFESGCPNDNCLTSGDRVCDTPPDQAIFTGCSFNSCSTDTDDKSSNNPLKMDIDDLTQNFMDYSPLDCYRTFTKGQSARMNYTVHNIRQSLLDSKGCKSPCTLGVKVDLAASDTLVADGGKIKFTNKSINATSYKWLINNELKGSGFNFEYIFTSPGTYKIELIGENIDPNCTTSKIIFIKVFCSTKSAFSSSSYNININDNVFASNLSSAANTFEWIIDAVPFSTQKDINFSFSTVGIHNVVLIAKGQNCNDTTNQKYIVSCNHNLNLTSASKKYKIDETFSIIANSTIPNLKYQWSKNNQLLPNNNSQLLGKELLQGLYTFCVTTSDNSCSSVACIDILVTDVCQLNYFKKYENQSREVARCIINNPSGGFIIGGGRNNGALILQSDNNLNINAQKALDLTNSTDIIYDLMIDSDNNLLAVGSYSPGSSSEADFILKYDYVNQKVIWARKLDESGVQCISYNIIQNPQSKNYIITGQYYEGSGNIDALMLEIDYSTGQTLWQKLYDMTDQAGDSESFYKSVLLDNAIYCAGRYTLGQAPGFEGMRFSFSKFDIKGNQIYSKYYLKSSTETARMYLLDMFPEANNFYACGLGDLSGVDLTNGATSQLLKIKEDGDLIWAKDYNIVNGQKQRLYKMLKLNDGIVLLGYYEKNGNENIYIIKTDRDGNVIWKKSIDYGGQEEVYGAILAGSDIIFTGMTIKNNGDQDIILGKINVNGSLQNPCSSVTELELIVTNLDPITYKKDLSVYSKQIDNEVANPIVLANENYNTIDVCNISTTDISIKQIKATCNSDSLIQITICNNGTKNFNEKIPIAFYKSNPAISNPKIEKRVWLDVNLAAGICKEYTIKAFWKANDLVYIVINDNNVLSKPYNLKKDILNSFSTECIFENNIDSFKLNQALEILDLGPDVELCTGIVKKITAQKGFKKYLWQDGSMDSTLTISRAGKYWVKVTDECGIIQIDTITIKEKKLTIDLGKNQLVCLGQEVKIFASIGFDEYRWSDKSGAISCNNCSVITVQPIQKNTYYVVGLKNGCIAFDSVVIEPVKLDVTIGKDTVLCPFQQLTLSASIKPDSSSWYYLGGTKICTNCDKLVLFPKQNTTIVFEGYLGDCVLSDTINIKLKANYINLGDDKKLCLGDTLILDAKGYKNIEWSSDNEKLNCNSCDNIKIIPTKNAKFFLKAEQNSCTVFDTISTTLTNLQLSLGNGLTLCKDDTIILSSNQQFDSYIWKKNGNVILCNNCTSVKVISDGTPIIYTLEVTKDKCRAKADVFLAVEDKFICEGCRIGKVFLPNIFSPNDDGINDVFYPQAYNCDLEVTIFRVFDRWGSMVFEKMNIPINDATYGWKGDFKGLSAQEGIYTYYLEISYNQGKYKTYKGDVMIIR